MSAAIRIGLLLLLRTTAPIQAATHCSQSLDKIQNSNSLYASYVENYFNKIPAKFNTSSYPPSGLSKEQIYKLLHFPTKLSDEAVEKRASEGQKSKESVFHPSNVMRAAFNHLFTITRSKPSEGRWGTVAALRYRALRDIFTAYSDTFVSWSAQDSQFKDGSYLFEGALGYSVVIRGSDGALFLGRKIDLMPQGVDTYEVKPDFETLLEENSLRPVNPRRR